MHSLCSVELWALGPTVARVVGFTLTLSSSVIVNTYIWLGWTTYVHSHSVQKSEYTPVQYFQSAKCFKIIIKQ